MNDVVEYIRNLAGGYHTASSVVTEGFLSEIQVVDVTNASPRNCE
jgi:hypothetical protein